MHISDVKVINVPKVPEVPEVPEVLESPVNKSLNTTPSLSQNVSSFSRSQAPLLLHVPSIGLELIGSPSQNEPPLSLAQAPHLILSVGPRPKRANVRLLLGQERIRLEFAVLAALSSALLGIMLMLLRKRCIFSPKTKRRRHDEHTV